MPLWAGYACQFCVRSPRINAFGEKPLRSFCRGSCRDPEFREERPDSLLNVVANGTDLINGFACGVVEVPAEVADCGLVA